MKMSLVSKLKQSYRYHRNWRKYKRRKMKVNKLLDKQLEFYGQFVKKNDLCFDVGASEVFLALL